MFCSTGIACRHKGGGRLFIVTHGLLAAARRPQRHFNQVYPIHPVGVFLRIGILTICHKNIITPCYVIINRIIPNFHLGGGANSDMIS